MGQRDRNGRTVKALASQAQAGTGSPEAGQETRQAPDSGWGDGPEGGPGAGQGSDREEGRQRGGRAAAETGEGRWPGTGTGGPRGLESGGPSEEPSGPFWPAGRVLALVLVFLLAGMLGASGLVLQGVRGLDQPWLRLLLEPAARQVQGVSAALGLGPAEAGLRVAWQGWLAALPLGSRVTGGPATAGGPGVGRPGQVAAPGDFRAGESLAGGQAGVSAASRSGESVQSAQPTDPSAVSYGPHRPFRLVVLGDSQAMGPDFAFKRDVGTDPWFSYQGEYRLSATLVNPGILDLQARLAALLEPSGCGALVVFLGSNDGQPMELDGQELAFGSPAWQAALRQRARDFLALATSRSRQVYWVASPPMRDSRLNQRVQAVNAWYRQVAAEFPRVVWLDFRDLLYGPDGGYVQSVAWQGQQLEIRKEDGIHLSRTGYELVCARILYLIHDHFGFDRPRPVYRIFGQSLSGL